MAMQQRSNPALPDTGAWWKPTDKGATILGTVHGFFTGDFGRNIILKDVVVTDANGKRDAYTFAKVSHQSLDAIILDSDAGNTIMIRFDGMVTTKKNRTARSYSVFDVDAQDAANFRATAKVHDFPYRTDKTPAPVSTPVDESGVEDINEEDDDLPF